MRFVATVFVWLVATAALAVAVPTLWAQRNIVSEDGYARLAAEAAKDPDLRRAMASELTTQITALGADTGYALNPDLVRGVAMAYTGNAGFPGQFGAANRIAHRWVFSDAVEREQGSQDRWLIDIAPMLNDSSLKASLGGFDLDVPATYTVPITVPETTGLTPGKLRPMAVWGPWVSVGSTILAAVFAFLTLVASRSRGKALAALGVSALLVGAAGWAGLEVVRGHIDRALDQTAGDIRQIADLMVNHAEGSLHLWLNLTLAAGGVMVVFGVVVSMLRGVRRRD